MSDKLASPRAKVERAKEHLIEVQAIIDGWLDTNPYTVVREQDPNTERVAYVFHLTHKLPEKLSLAVGDTIHNLRSALDHLICALVRENCGTVTTDTGFPIVRHAKDLKSAIGSKVKGADSRVMRAVESLKPYERGTDCFWTLHHLDIGDKHRLLLTTIVEKDWVDLLMYEPLPWMRRGTGMFNRVRAHSTDKGPLEDGTVLRTVPPGGMDVKPEHTFQVSIHEPPIVESKPIIPFLQQHIDFTERIIGVFDKPFFFARP